MGNLDVKKFFRNLHGLVALESSTRNSSLILVWGLTRNKAEAERKNPCKISTDADNNNFLPVFQTNIFNY